MVILLAMDFKGSSDIPKERLIYRYFFMFFWLYKRKKSRYLHLRESKTMFAKIMGLASTTVYGVNLKRSWA